MTSVAGEGTASAGWPVVEDPEESIAAWAESGALALTGREDEPPLGPPAGLVPKVRRLGAGLQRRAERTGRELALDPMRLLTERAAILDLTRHGELSCGRQTRLLRCRDGWIAVTLARREDEEAIPALLGIGCLPSGADLWDEVRGLARREAASALVGRAQLLGIAASVLSGGAGLTRVVPPACLFHPPGRAGRDLRQQARSASPPRRTGLDGAMVVDLTSLWAGPLCTSVLSQLGADVVKVESTGRPDGARRGVPAFFDLMNGGKRSVALDFGSAREVEWLRRLLLRAEVVVEASRPRALEQLGIVAQELLVSGRSGPRVWLSITGYGRTGTRRNWSAFGDDGAVAGGLVARDDRGPTFCSDAIADPLTGLVAADACVAALQGEARLLVEVTMAGVAARFAGPTLRMPSMVNVPRPIPRPIPRTPPLRAPTLGEHNDEVLGSL